MPSAPSQRQEAWDSMQSMSAAGGTCLADRAQGGVEALLLEPGGELAVAALHRAQVLQVVRQRLPALELQTTM